jgi:Tol biopolymer transport system component
VRDLAISPSQNEIYFSAQSYLGELSAIVTCTLKNGKWSKPEVAAFSGRFADLEPFFSPDGLRLYFVSNRPLDTLGSEAKDYDIWLMERKNMTSVWSQPKNLGAPVNTSEDEFYPSVSKFNNLIFTRDGAGSKGKDDLFYCKWENGNYATPVSMNDSINTAGYEFNGFLAPDESFILFTCYNRAGGYGSGDLYISFNKGNNEWTMAENLGAAINSPMMDYCPYVDLSSGMLYFTSKRSTVKKQFDKKQGTADVLKEMKKYDNGQSRLYQVNISKLIGRKP